MVSSRTYELSPSKEPILLDLIIRIVVSLGALLGAAAAAQNLTSENSLDWTGNHLLDTVIFWGLCLLATTAFAGPIGGWAFISALVLSLLVAGLGALTDPTLSSIAFLVIVLTTTILAIRGKAWRIRGADLSEKKQKERTPKKNSNKNALGTVTKIGVGAYAVKKLSDRSSQRGAPVVKYKGKGTYLGCAHLGGNAWELSFQDENSGKVRKKKVNKGNDKGMATTRHYFDLEW